MASFAVLGIEISDCSSDVEPPVSTLSDIFVISKLKHQLVASLGILSGCETPLFDTFAEAVISEEDRSVSSICTGKKLTCETYFMSWDLEGSFYHSTGIVEAKLTS